MTNQEKVEFLENALRAHEADKQLRAMNLTRYGVEFVGRDEWTPLAEQIRFIKNYPDYELQET